MSCLFAASVAMATTRTDKGGGGPEPLCSLHTRSFRWSCSSILHAEPAGCLRTLQVFSFALVHFSNRPWQLQNSKCTSQNSSFKRQNATDYLQKPISFSKSLVHPSKVKICVSEHVSTSEWQVLFSLCTEKSQISRVVNITVYSGGIFSCKLWLKFGWQVLSVVIVGDQWQDSHLNCNVWTENVIMTQKGKDSTAAKWEHKTTSLQCWKNYSPVILFLLTSTFWSTWHMQLKM